MDNLNKYLPVGEANAKPATAVTLSGNTMIGNAWIEDDAATEVSLNSTSAIESQSGIISGVAIAVLGSAEPPPQAQRPRHQREVRRERRHLH